MRDQKPKIGIALSGGGARGIAHIGVLKALIENDIQPTVVSGTSSGAIVATMYAYGASIEEIVNFARIGSNLKLLRIGNPLKGLMKLSILKEKLEAVFSEDCFSCLQHDLFITATDLQRGKLKIFDKGEIIAPVMASCAIPLIFNPVEIDGYQYVDGGLYLNLPSQIIQKKCDILLGSNVMPVEQQEIEQLSSMFAIGNRVFDLSVSNNSEESRQICDVLFEPKGLGKFHVYNFTKTDELIEVGYNSAMEKMPVLLSLIDDMKASAYQNA